MPARSAFEQPRQANFDVGLGEIAPIAGKRELRTRQRRSAP